MGDLSFVLSSLVSKLSYNLHPLQLSKALVYIQFAENERRIIYQMMWCIGYEEEDNSLGRVELALFGFLAWTLWRDPGPRCWKWMLLFLCLFQPFWPVRYSLYFLCDRIADNISTGQSIKILTLFSDIITGGVVNALRRGKSRDARSFFGVMFC